MPNWTILLVPPLLLIACLLARGLFDRHPGHRVAAVPGRHFPGGRARQAEDIDAAREIAWVARVQHHGPSPLLARQMEVAALTAAIPCWEPCPPADGPVPAALADVDGDSPWKDSEPFSDWERDSVVMRALDKERQPAMTRDVLPRVCGFCAQPAVWRWKPRTPPPAYNSLLCDDHAAQIDLDELEELAAAS